MIEFTTEPTDKMWGVGIEVTDDKVTIGYVGKDEKGNRFWVDYFTALKINRDEVQPLIDALKRGVE